MISRLGTVSRRNTLGDSLPTIGNLASGTIQMNRSDSLDVRRRCLGHSHHNVRPIREFTRGNLMSEAAAPSTPKKQESVFLISYPKVIFLWPTLVVSIVASIYMWMSSEPIEVEGNPTPGAVVCAWTFLIALSLNLIVISFDFPRGTSLTIFFIVIALILGGSLLVTWNEGIFDPLRNFLVGLKPTASPTFYSTFAMVMVMIYVGVLVQTRFDYWEVRPNELLHHHGFLSDLERLSAPNLQIEKEINDVFEYLLAGSGRLILRPAHDRRVIILDNVLRIGQKENAITKMLGALQVQVRTDST